MLFVKTDVIVKEFEVTIEGVLLKHENPRPQTIQVVCSPTGQPQYARCKALHIVVIGLEIWQDYFGKHQTARIKRICRGAVTRYFEEPKKAR